MTGYGSVVKYLLDLGLDPLARSPTTRGDVLQYCPLINETLDFRILEILLRDGRVNLADLGNAALQ
jgi:hypothetical protein